MNESVATPDGPREGFIRNRARCLTCDTIIESTFRHDFRMCECPPGSGTSIFVDGGHDYRRMGAGPQARWEAVPDDGD